MIVVLGVIIIAARAQFIVSNIFLRVALLPLKCTGFIVHADWSGIHECHRVWDAKLGVDLWRRNPFKHFVVDFHTVSSSMILEINVRCGAQSLLMESSCEFPAIKS